MVVAAKIQFIFSLGCSGLEQQKTGQSQQQNQQFRQLTSQSLLQKSPHSTKSPTKNMMQDNPVAIKSTTKVPMATLWLSMVELNPLCNSSLSCWSMCGPNAQNSAQASIEITKKENSIPIVARAANDGKYLGLLSLTLSCRRAPLKQTTVSIIIIGMGKTMAKLKYVPTSL